MTLPLRILVAVLFAVALSAAPARAETRVSLGAGLGYLLANDRALSRLGTALARMVVDGRVFVEALVTGINALWSTAAGPVAAVLALFLLASLFGLKRFAGSNPTPSEA